MVKSRIKHSTSDSRIDKFIFLTTPLITGIVEQLLRKLQLDIEKKGQGLETKFCIKNNEHDIEFHMRNLLLEIAAIDRDENPMQFDEQLKDFGYFMSKMNQLIDSKLRVLLELIFEKDLDKASENIAKLSNNFERIRIWKMDIKDKPSSGR